MLNYVKKIYIGMVLLFIDFNLINKNPFFLDMTKTYSYTTFSQWATQDLSYLTKPCFKAETRARPKKDNANQTQINKREKLSKGTHFCANSSTYVGVFCQTIGIMQSGVMSSTNELIFLIHINFFKIIYFKCTFSKGF